MGNTVTKCDDLLHTWHLPLEDLYNGRNLTLAVNRQRICKTCKGAGKVRPPKEQTANNKCVLCNNVTRNPSHDKEICSVQGPISLGLSPQQRRSSTFCVSCEGGGKMTKEDSEHIFRPTTAEICPSCHGYKTVKERNMIEFYVSPGMQDGQKIVLHGQADERPGMQPGSVIIEIREKKHERFQRQGLDLFMEQEISLIDALSGYVFVLKHLDGRVLRLGTGVQPIIHPDAKRVVVGEGFPRLGEPNQKGLLLVTFKVMFPNYVDPSTYPVLRKILGSTSTGTRDQNVHTGDSSITAVDNMSSHADSFADQS